MHPPLAQHQHVCELRDHAGIEHSLMMPPACKEFIDALDRCHATGWNRLTGACNEVKIQLNMCLRAEVHTPSLSSSQKEADLFYAFRHHG